MYFRKDLALRDRHALVEELKAHVDAAEKRDKWSRSDQAKAKSLEERIAEIDKQIAKYDAGERVYPEPFSGWQFQAARARAVAHGLGDGDGEGVALTREQRMTDWVAARNGGSFGIAGDGIEDGDAAEMSLGAIVRAMVTGRRDGMTDAEKRALSEGTDSAGGFLTPEDLSARLIDRVRNVGQVFNAGASTIPLTSDTVNLARLTGGVTPSWKVEGNPITDSSMTFDRVTFKPRTLPLLVKISQELFDDMSPAGYAMIEGEIAKAIALELDRAALYGSGVAPEPLGIKNQAGVVLTAFGGANGATPTNYDFLLDGIQTLRGSNFEPDGFMFAPRTQRTLDGLKDAQNRYLDAPPSYKQIAKFSTNQVPTNLTVGTSTGVCSDVFVGKWSELLIGVRPALGLRVKVLQERFADNLQVAILAWIRADVQLAHATAFNVISGVKA